MWWTAHIFDIRPLQNKVFVCRSYEKKKAERYDLTTQRFNDRKRRKSGVFELSDRIRVCLERERERERGFEFGVFYYFCTAVVYAGLLDLGLDG